MKKFSELKAPKDKSMEEDMDLEMLAEEDMDAGDEQASDIEEALSAFSKEEIQAYLDSLEGSEEDSEEDDEILMPEEISGGEYV